MLEPETIDRVKTTARPIIENPDEFGTEFYRRLFEAAPDIRMMFPDDIDAQAMKLSQTLALAVAGLEDFPRLLPKLQEIGRRHASYGTEAAHYDLVGATLIDTLAATSPIWSDADALAWMAVYDVVADIMLTAANAAETPATGTG